MLQHYFTVFRLSNIKQEVLGGTNRLLFIDTSQTAQTMTPPIIPTSLPSRCLATMGGYTDSPSVHTWTT
jgi:hypothetical protein